MESSSFDFLLALFIRLLPGSRYSIAWRTVAYHLAERLMSIPGNSPAGLLSFVWLLLLLV
jgi:hypothetical protein